MLESEYQPTPAVSDRIHALADYLKSADVNSVEGQSFLDLTMRDRLHDERVRELKSLAGVSDPESREKNLSDLRITEGRISILAHSMDYKEMNLPGYSEGLSILEEKWNDLGAALADEAGSIFQDDLESREVY